jgi:Fe2+ transport system protein B
MMEASSVRGLAKECWLRLRKWPRRILTIVAALVGVVWVANRIPCTDRSC